jgi:D-alanyl-D-alanine carboxypeptidase
MDYRTSRSAPTHPAPRIVVGLVILGVTVAAFLMRRSLVAASAPPSSSGTSSTAGTAGTAGAASPPEATSEVHQRGSNRRSALGKEDGVVPDGTAVSVFDSDVPAVGRLDPSLLDALQRAATEADSDGINFRVDSGWRSPAYQQRLMEEAVAQYGSPEAAARWVATPQTSAHVSGEAVDLAPYDATAWLSAHGAAYGLCQIYGNEAWHYELRPAAARDGCPRMYADPTEDPRMRG